LERITPLKEALPPDFTFDEIRLVVANLRRRAGGGDDDNNKTLAAAK
jgi:hypothetical protein